MLTTPVIEFNEEQYYAAIEMEVGMQEVPSILPPLIPEVEDWLAQQNISPSGPAFFQYLAFLNDKLKVKVGFPVAEKIPGDARVKPGSFPTGRYAVTMLTGPYHTLKEAHMYLEEWCEQNASEEKNVQENEVTWGSRTEFYLTDPGVVTDPEQWQTKLAFLLKD